MTAPSQKMRTLLVDCRLGEIALDMTLDEVVRALGPDDGSIPHSRKNKGPSAKKFGWAQLFFYPDERLYMIGIYPGGDEEANQVLVDVELAEFLRAVGPAEVLDVAQGSAVTLIEELDGGRIVRERRTISDVHRDADCLRLILACGSEAIFVRHAPTARWRLEKMLGSRHPHTYPLRRG